MNPFRKLRRWLRRSSTKRVRGWSAAKLSTLNAGWLTWSRMPNADIRNELKVLRARSRAECQNNDHARHFLRLVKTNLIGKDGVRMQARVKNRRGAPNEVLNNAVEEAWRDWGRRGVCDVTSQLSWRDLQRSVVETCARDGEAVVRIIYGWENDYRYALQQIDPELLDVDYNEVLSSTREVVMGVEVDQWRRPVAFHFIGEPRGFNEVATQKQRERLRVPAAEVIHVYLPEWVNQTRGVPWFATALQRAHMLTGYEDAEVVAARTAASKMGFYTRDADAADYAADDEDSDGNPIQSASPGEFEKLPLGWNFTGWDPQHPNAQFSNFVKAMLRGMASGLGVNYNTLANDLEGVNYTSLRHGSLTERDIWMTLQDWIVEAFHDRVYRTWLESALLAGAVIAQGRPVDAGLEPEMRKVSWQPRRWPWVDPLKEMQAHQQAYSLRVRTIGSIIREQGDDPDEVWAEMQAERLKLAALDIPLPAEGSGGSSSSSSDESGDEDFSDDEDSSSDDEDDDGRESAGAAA